MGAAQEWRPPLPCVFCWLPLCKSCELCAHAPSSWLNACRYGVDSFLTLKRLWGFAKTRYRGLAKNANRAFAMLAMINLVKWGRPLTGEVRPI